MRLRKITGIMLIVLLMLVQSMAFNIASVFARPDRIVPSEETLGIYNFVESLSAGSVVILSFDFGQVALSENYPQAKAFLFHCKQRGLKVIGASFWAIGAPIGEDVFREVYGDEFPNIPEYGEDVVYIGLIPGGTVGLNMFAENTWSVIPVDHFGNSFSDLPLMDEVRSAADFDIWLEVCCGSPGAVEVIMFVGDPHGVPIGAGATLVVVPGLIPYYEVGQLIGFLNGVTGAAEYEYLLIMQYEYEPSLLPYLVGVKVGVWVKYGDFVGTWESEDPNASPPRAVVDANDTQWVENTVQAVSGVNVTFQTAIHFKNTTERTMIHSLDVNSGDGNGTFWFILTCMEPGETIYINSLYTINETTSRTYGSFTREVNHLNITQIQPHHNSSHNLYWDKITGTLTEWTIQESFLDNGYLTSWSTSFRMVDTNLWKTINVPEDYLTIQEAVDEAVAGDTVRVVANSYNERIVIRKALTLAGENREATIIDGGGAETTIKILASYVTVSGFTIQNGKGGIATSGFSQRGITISENILTSNTGEAIYLTNSHKSTLSENVIYSNQRGIFVLRCNNTAILDNVITQSSELGLWLSASSNNTLRNNELSDNYYNFMMTGVFLEMYIQDIDTSNTIDGKPMLYLLNEHNVIINHSTFPEVGYLAIVNSTNIHVSDIHLTRNEQTFLVAYTNSSTIKNVVLSHNGVGVRLEGSHDNVISGCTMQENDLGIWVRWYSHGNNITSNAFVNNYGAVSFAGSGDNRFLDNIVENNQEGVTLGSHNNVIARNNIINNTKGGVFVFFSSGNTISNNTIANNGWFTMDAWEFHMGGFDLWESDANTIKQNTIFGNRYGILIRESNNNMIYHNNFISNERQIYDFSWDDPWYPPSVNTWDDGYPSGGNYWSNYTGQDSEGDGIGDTPHIIDADNQDDYPLMNPWMPPGLRANLIQKGAWPEHHHYSIRRDEDAYQTLHARAKNLGTEPVWIRVTFNIMKKDGSWTLVETDIVKINPGEKADLSVNWAPSPGRHYVAATLQYSFYTVALWNEGEKTKAFSFRVTS